jgi:hypothetical protein
VFLQRWYAKNRDFVIPALTKNPPLNEAIPKPESEAGPQTEWE